MGFIVGNAERLIRDETLLWHVGCSALFLRPPVALFVLVYLSCVASSRIASHRIAWCCTYLPVSARGLTVNLWVVGQVPIPIDHLAAVARGSSRQPAEAQNAGQAGEAAARAHDPLVIV